MPGKELNIHALDFFTLLAAPELTDERDIFGLSRVKLAVAVVLELRVIDGLLRNFGAAEEPDTFNLKTGLCAKHCMTRKCVLAEGIESLYEAVGQVDSLKEYCALAAELFIL